MPTLRQATLPILLLTLDLCAQEGSTDEPGMVEAFNEVIYMSASDSVEFADFKKRNLSGGASYNVLSRSKGYRMVWHVHVENFNCTITRGDGRTLKEFQEDPASGYTTGEYVHRYGYGLRCVEVTISQRKRRGEDRWYFEAP